MHTQTADTQRLCEVRDIDWFKKQLLNRGVSQLEIVWGNYIEYFHAVPEHLMDSYLHYRTTMLHRPALELAMVEYKAIQTHPFSM